MNLLTEDILPSLQGRFPSPVATCSLHGVPNITGISQVYYVDATHIALSRQFFNKTVRNIAENPMVCVMVTCPVTYKFRKLILRFVESQTSGEVFEKMKLQLDIIASMQKRTGLFKLQASDIYEVLSIEVMG